MSDLTPGNRLDRPVDDEFDHALGPSDAAAIPRRSGERVKSTLC
jgi:hypothetical protein